MAEKTGKTTVSMNVSVKAGLEDALEDLTRDRMCPYQTKSALVNQAVLEFLQNHTQRKKRGGKFIWVYDDGIQEAPEAPKAASQRSAAEVATDDLLSEMFG